MQGLGLISNNYHSFPIQLAMAVGERKAVILSNIQFWIEKNRANEKNFHDGRYWTYNSAKAFTKIFPYLNQRKIEHALSGLQKDGYLITGNYNKAKYDRTCWYALGDKALPYFYLPSTAETLISHKKEMESANMLNGFTKSVEPIPDINTDIKPDKKTIAHSSKYSEEFERWWSIYPRKQGKGKAYANWKREKLNLRVDELIEKLQQQVAMEYAFIDPRFIPHGSTYLNESRYDDDVVARSINNETNFNNNHKPGSFKYEATKLSRTVDENRHILDEIPDDHRF